MSELVLSSSWANPDKRRARATRAARDMDAAALGELLVYYLVHEGRKAAAVSPQTRRAYLSGMRAFLTFAGPPESPGTPLLSCSREAVKRYVVHEQLRGLAPESVRLNLAAVRCLFRALAWAGAILGSPAEDVSAPPDPRPREERRGAVALSDFERLVETVSASDAAPLIKARDLLMLYLFGEQGLRCSEAAALCTEDVNLRRKTLHVRSGKGGKSATLPLTQNTAQALTAYLELHPVGSGALLVNLEARTRKALLHKRMSPEAIRAAMKRLYDAAGLENQAVHALRHTSGTLVYRRTKDIVKVMRWLRHSSTSTSIIYTKMGQDDLLETADTFG